MYFLKKYQQNGFPATDLQEFLKECSSKEKCQEESPAFLSSICCLRRSVLCRVRSPCSQDEMLCCLNKESSQGKGCTQKSADWRKQCSLPFFPPTALGFRNLLFLIKQGTKVHDMVGVSWEC